MANFQVVYGTTYGQTAKIVDRIAKRLRAGGHQVSVWRGDLWPEGRALDDFDGFLIAGSVLYGRHQRYLEEFVRSHLVRLNALPSAFLSVCGALAGPRPKGPEDAAEQIGSFLARTKWRPRLVDAFAGGLPYTQYGLLTRWTMRLINHYTGRPTDTSRDWEFTDWDQVDRFADRLARCVTGPEAVVQEQRT